MRVTLVHDYLTQYGGAERVLEAMHDLYPEAPTYTSVYAPDHLPRDFASWDIRTGLIDRLPGAAATHRLWLPLYPATFSRIGESIGDADVILADSSAWSHHVAMTTRIPVICYCHSPARFLYGDRDYLESTAAQRLARYALAPLFGNLRGRDRRAAARVRRYVTNSQAVADRVMSCYGIPAEVIYPPIETTRFRPAQLADPEDWFLVVSRLVPHKWIDRAVRACTEAGFRLKIIGEGRARADLQRIAGPGIEFLGQLGDAAVVDHMQRCRALILPGVEDFGMTAVEVQAAGRPVIAARGGGALETVVDGETGFFFDPADPASLTGALRAASTREWDSAAIVEQTKRFDIARFNREIRAVVDEVATEGAR
ncbi:MAG TPA: glycosyltransferase [Thermomicrobiales bacterium]|nr:glycosyltransferase [Thermomicrobiales bacterium]